MHNKARKFLLILTTKIVENFPHFRIIQGLSKKIGFVVYIVCFYCLCFINYQDNMAFFQNRLSCIPFFGIIMLFVTAYFSGKIHLLYQGLKNEKRTVKASGL